jgi:hypothetical protein
MKPPSHTPAPVSPQRAYPFLLLRYVYYSIYTMIPPLLPPFPLLSRGVLIWPIHPLRSARARVPFSMLRFKFVS